ncbi:peptidoglycan/xylan/chitin deacetylase (PgdA/CDA1 family) [Streptomyces sp. 2333.5]|uniref:polysaccharide deacetylase family protein n=1 Tax=Streptomyces TaxID=1883 RepID=UPI00089C684C|nr:MULTISPECIES: polysaccharide deacetylase family protein [unclassified Streptomyces]PJJ05610.1 peptidoglycan/xylan/chitin deacetylase (PgdA/CDA1 family) [Streptomyces sp. 2333.5]SEE80244.1 Peptidoglycan/xylan/chitin deacetylase, PgdA/CDA1 family [Streptomyces sp. 2314.4]SEF01587.1 Peptidoglycan/xylan/chitin deacetylase, PgdA/CDA1 family [Streptomyces sp. 2112.2]SOE10041.1 Peptidoglycan/xylan/chitin deacetylase, PgdA/CDA1 family [Streptomyces sp. 2323.1]
MARRFGVESGIIGVTAAAVVSVVVAGALAFSNVGGPSKAEAEGVGSQKAKRAAAPVDSSIVHASDRPGRSLNITIDDGPDPVWTPKVLEVLKRYNVKAVFCMIGPQAEAHPDLVKKVAAAGHKLCDHTMSHNTGMGKKPESYQSQEILGAQKKIEKAAGGAQVEYYRAPGGAFTPYSRKLAAEHGMRPLGWNVDSKDFEGGSVATIESTVRGELSNGPTVLFHDGGGDRSRTVDSLNRLLPWMQSQGYGFGFPKR